MLISESERLTRRTVTDASRAMVRYRANDECLHDAIKDLRDTPQPSKHLLLYCNTLLHDWLVIHATDLSEVPRHEEIAYLFEVINNELAAIGVRPPWKYLADAA